MRAAFYKCAAAKQKKTCDKKSVRKQWPEDLAVSETMKLVEDDAMESIIAKVMELQARIAEKKAGKAQGHGRVYPVEKRRKLHPREMARIWIALLRQKMP